MVEIRYHAKNPVREGVLVAQMIHSDAPRVHNTVRNILLSVATRTRRRQQSPAPFLVMQFCEVLFK